jgi:hypothetical protein
MTQQHMMSHLTKKQGKSRDEARDHYNEMDKDRNDYVILSRDHARDMSCDLCGGMFELKCLCNHVT